jgi:hypothetical protein
MFLNWRSISSVSSNDGSVFKFLNDGNILDGTLIRL